MWTLIFGTTLWPQTRPGSDQRWLDLHFPLPENPGFSQQLLGTCSAHFIFMKIRISTLNLPDLYQIPLISCSQNREEHGGWPTHPVKNFLFCHHSGPLVFFGNCGVKTASLNFTNTFLLTFLFLSHNHVPLTLFEWIPCLFLQSSQPSPCILN